MRIKNSVSSIFDIEMEKGEELYMRFGGEDAIKIVVGENKGSISLHLQKDALLKDGGPNIIRNTGKINSYAQIEFDLKEEE